MAVIEGQIEPLKKLKEILEQYGITRFGSIGEIHSFTKNYEAEKKQIPKVIENEFDTEVAQLHIDLSQYQRDYDVLKNDVANETNQKINELKGTLILTKEKSKKSLIHKIFCYPRTKILINKIAKLEKNFGDIVSKKTSLAREDVSRIQEKLNDYTVNREAFISRRCLQSSQELERIKDVVDGLYNLISGAIGENSVIKEIQKLPDNFHLFNDFSVEFNPPIYNKKENDRIYSIQIDHLLVCQAGLFIIETKNWSKQSVENVDLRSPVKQIMRSNYALFVLLNNHSNHNINLGSHHWGRKQIPIRNLIVMTNAKPIEEFKHVKVLSLAELNRYVTYFNPIFSSAEIESISGYLRMGIS
jgi:hypothetical protein